MEIGYKKRNQFSFKNWKKNAEKIWRLFIFVVSLQCEKQKESSLINFRYKLRGGAVVSSQGSYGVNFFIVIYIYLYTNIYINDKGYTVRINS